MVEVWLPYGSTEVVARIRYENLMGIYQGKPVDTLKDFDRAINQSLDNASNVKLEDLANRNEKAVIIVEEPKSRLLRKASSIIRSRIMQYGGLPEDVITVWGGFNQLSDLEYFVDSEGGSVREVNHDFTSNLTTIGKGGFRKTC